MVDETEFGVMDAEEGRDTQVVIRLIQGTWCIAHAGSYQSAFRARVNCFDTREQAAEFAEFNDCEIMFHCDDQLQAFVAT